MILEIVFDKESANQIIKTENFTGSEKKTIRCSFACFIIYIRTLAVFCVRRVSAFILLYLFL